MKHRPALALALCLAAVACRRSGANNPPATPTDTAHAPTPTPRPAADAAHASDALVLVPGEGIGAFTLGATRAAVSALAGGGAAPDARTVEVDGVTLLFDGDAPGGVVTGVRVRLAGAGGGVRVGNALVAPAATYPEVISAVGNCGAPTQSRGGTITPCQDGAVKILQAGPAQELWLDVSR